MKVSELIKKLELGEQTKPNAEVVIYCQELDGYTGDIGISYDDNNDIELYIIGGAKAY